MHFYQIKQAIYTNNNIISIKIDYEREGLNFETSLDNAINQTMSQFSGTAPTMDYVISVVLKTLVLELKRLSKTEGQSWFGKRWSRLIALCNKIKFNQH